MSECRSLSESQQLSYSRAPPYHISEYFFTLDFYFKCPMFAIPRRLETLAISFTPLCQCLSEETLKAIGPFYLVSMPGEVKDRTQGVNV